jgi:calcineurin-like phosphoesterase family protein
MKYIISDTHFGHDNIIEYTERPFDSVTEMNTTLVKNWNNKVDEEDTVIHLGDVRHHPDPQSTAWWLNKLNGEILLVRGNHDNDVGQNAPVNAVRSATLKHGRYEFYLEHQPVGFSGWQLHGHAHNNDLTNYPFINRSRKTVNLSVELIGYEPLAMDRLVQILDKRQRHTTIGDYADTYQ